MFEKPFNYEKDIAGQVDRNRGSLMHPNVKASVNPYKPGEGLWPPYLAGRQDHQRAFVALLQQQTVVRNLAVTGLRGVGKSVLLQSFKPFALQAGSLWVDVDAGDVPDENMFATRLLTA